MQDSRNFNKINPAQLRKWLDDGRALRLIDTLPEEVFARRHIPGAENACVYEVGFPEKVKVIVKDLRFEIVVYGSSKASKDAETAAEKLTRLGYEKVYALEGGIAGWREAGFTLEGEAPNAPEDPGTRFKPVARDYRVDTAQSVIEWTGRNPNGRHHGTLRLSGGEIKAVDGRIGGSLEIDMRSIRSIDLSGDELEPVLISHLESDDFFFVKMFPTARFTITSIDLLKESTLTAPNVKVTGTLELRGVKRDISFPATVSNQAESGITAEAHFDFDRTQWHILYGSSKFFEYLGKHLVFDPISLQIRIVAHAS